MTRLRVRISAVCSAAFLVIASAVPAASPGAATLPPFYDVPDPLPTDGPGTVVDVEDVPAPGLHGTMQRVMYTSISLSGETIAVTGIIAVPDTPAPPGGHPVVAWAHGTTGIADACAPSLDPLDAVPFANNFLDRGWAVVATDYEGLGTPGRHPYIVGDSEARGTIDIVRAARNLHADLGSDYVVWGHSQGGHAAMFSLDIAESWAPELNLVGVVAGAPPSQLDLVYAFLVESPYKYYLLMVAAAINAAYGDAEAPLSEVLNPEGIAMVDLVDQGCTGFLADESEGIDVESLMVTQPDGTFNPLANPVWGPLIRAQDPGNFTDPADAPLLIIHGGADEQIPAPSSQLLADQSCAIGQTLERWLYPGQSHAGVIGPSLTDMTSWMADRFAGVPAPGASVLSDGAEVEATVCVDGSMVPRTAPVPPTDPGDDPDPGSEPSDGGPGDPPPATPVRARPVYTG